MSEAPAMRRAEWRKNWTLVLACSLGMSFSSVLNYSFGVFIGPLTKEFGWGRADVSFGLTITAFVSVILSPFVGMLIDRYGVRRLAIPGIMLLTASTASFALANGSKTQWIALWAIFAIIDLSVKSTIWTTAVARTFNAARSMAIALTLGGVSVAQIIGQPLAANLIGNFGWRTAFITMGAGWGVITFLACLLFLFDARDRRRRDGVAETVKEAPLDGMTLREALKSWPLIRIGIATFLALTTTVAVQVHTVPLLTGGGISLQNAAWLASLGGMAGIAGKLITGWLLDRKNAGTIGALILVVSALAFGLLLDAVRTVPMAIVAIAVSGFAAATKLQLCVYLTSRYAGMRSFGSIFGIMSSLVALAGGLGPYLAGAIFDRYKTYDPLVYASVILTLIAAWLIVGLGNYHASEAEPALSPA